MGFFTQEEVISLVILFVSCVVMLMGFSLRKFSWGPWLMLLGIIGVLLVIAYNILRHTGSL